MNIKYDEVDKLLTCQITEEIDHHTTEKIRRILDDEIERYIPKRMVFDFDKVSFMDSAGIGMILGRYKMMRMLGGSMEMINVNSNVRKIFEMSGIPKIIQINWCRGGFAWEFCGTKFAHCKSTHALKWKEKIKMENKVKLELMSKSSNEAFARIAIAAFVSQLDPTIEEIADIKTAVSEAVTNCIIHGYEEKEGLIYITCVLNM